MTPDPEKNDFPEPIEWHNIYQVGVTEFHPAPDSWEIRHMVYLVAYDIADPKRLRLVAKACEEYGARIEKSVFQCDITPELFQQLWLELMEIIDEDEDAVVAFRICQSCLRQTESMGIVPLPRKPVCYIL